MILVVGATGRLGSLIARMLADEGQDVRVLVRAGSSLDDLAPAAEAVVGDLRDPASLQAACAGADAVVTTANSVGRGGDETIESVDRVGNRSLIDAAAAAGVRRFLFTSALGADRNSPSPFLRAKGESEQRLRDSGMAWTVLQPNVFMDILIPAVVGYPALTGGRVTLAGEGRRRHSFVAARDVAAYAVAALRHEAAVGQTLVVAGPEPISWRDVVATFERELGRAPIVETVAPGAPVPGLPAMAVELLAALEMYDSPIDIGQLSATYGVEPTSLIDFVRGFIAANRAQNLSR